MYGRHENALQRMSYESEHRMEEQVEGLRDKMRLLQVDRKSNVDLLESTKETNKEYIRQMKMENRELRKQLSEFKRNGSSPMVTTSEDITQSITTLNRLRKQHDELRHKVCSETNCLEELKDEVKDLELESKKPSIEDTPDTRKIRMLENRLDKAMIKFNEAQSIRKTYEQIVKRLKEERIGFDHQLAALERALEAKAHDYEELVLLSSDATHAREAIVIELEKARGFYEEEKRHRMKELKDKTQYLSIRMEMNTRIDTYEKQKIEIVSKETNDLNGEEEKHLKQSLAMTVLQQGIALEEKKEHRSKIDIFESAFRKIKEATGVSDVNEVIQKIVSQESTTDNLIHLSKENQVRIEQLQAESTLLKTKVEELKYSGSGGGHRRKMVDDYEQNVALAMAKLERAKLKYERFAKALISVKAGVEHLVDKLESVRDDDQVVVVTDETIVDALQESEVTLTRLLNQIKTGQVNPNPSLLAVGSGAAAVVKRKEATNLTRTASIQSTVSTDVSDTDMILTRPYNQRVALPGDLTRDEMENDEFSMGNTNGTGLLIDDNEEALSRDRVKKASHQVVLAQDKKKKRMVKKKQKDQLGDSDEEDTMIGDLSRGISLRNPSKKR